MTYSAKLVRGSYTFDLNDGKYSLGQDFAPPGVLETAFLSGGTSANRSGGADLVGTRAENRSWSFTVRCLGSVSAETHNLASRLTSFLAGATDTRQDKTYFEFRPDADLPEPIWGTFGQALRYEVVHATTALDSIYGRGRINRSAVVVMVNLTIKPYAQGRPIRAAVALGGVMEDRIGTVDGSSRGLIVSPPTTNFVKNPIFGHGTPMNGWTATTVTATVDLRNQLFGTPTVLLSGAAGTFRATTAANSVTGNHVLSCYAKRVDGQPVTASDLQLSWNAALRTTSFQSMGNGWYRLTTVMNVTGAGLAFQFGIDTLANGVAVYISGWQFEAGNFPTAVCWGDMLGCAWTGTAHDSSSSRIKGAVILTGEALSKKPVSAFGTIRMTMIYTGESNYCFSKATGTDFKAYVQSARVVFSNGATVVDAAITPGLAVGDAVTIHFTWNRTAIAAYINGALVQSTAGTISNIIDSLNIGGHFTFNYYDSKIIDFAIFDQALTETQVAADYAQVQPLKDAKVNIGRIPWIYTKEVVSNVNRVRNALDANNSNYAVVGGVPGSAEADVVLQYLNGDPAYTELLLSRFDTREFVHPAYLYAEQSGTADAACSGGAYLSVSISNVPSEKVYVDLTIPAPVLSALEGRNIYLLARVGDVGSGLQIMHLVRLNGYKLSNWKNFTLGAGFAHFLLDPIYIQELDPVDDFQRANIIWSMILTRASGSATAAAKIDYFQIMPGPILKTSGFNDSAYNRGVLYDGNQSNLVDTLGYLDAPRFVVGDEFQLTPDRYNTLVFGFSHLGANVITNYYDLQRLILTPRWHLL